MPLPTGSSWLDIDLTEVDAESPVDDVLANKIAENLYYLKLAAGGGGGVFPFVVNGPGLSGLTLPFRRIDAQYVSEARTLSKHGVALEIPGLSGTLEVDVRKYNAADTPISAISKVYSAAIQSITRAGSSISTQSITKATAQVNTQSISFWKASINVSSIIYLGANLWRYNLASALDSDWVVGDSVTFASCTSAGNNGTFTIVRKNDDDLNNIVVRNTAGVAQTGAAGTATLQAMSYNLTNPASSQFVVGESAIFASHTTGANNGTFALYAVNSGGNNLVVKNSAGVAQAGVAGTCDAARWVYTYSSAVSADYVVGEYALMASHTTGANNGNFRITAVNSGGNNIVVYNTAGVAQGAAAGNANTNRWIYALPTDPTSSFSVGQTFKATGTTVSGTSYPNNGTFTVVQINRSSTNNLVVANTSGVTQAGAAGTLDHTRRIVSFPTNQGTTYSTASRIKIVGTPDGEYSGDEYEVEEINRGGGSNFNVVIECPDGAEQASPAGRVSFESRSVFSTRPSITVHRDMRSVTNGVLDATEKDVAAGRVLAMEILQVPTGSPENLTVFVA